MEPGTCRAIEYEIWPRQRTARMRSVGRQVEESFANSADIAVLKCVDDQGRKLTLFDDAEHFQRLLASGEARDPKGMKLSESSFPVVLSGWLPAS